MSGSKGFMTYNNRKNTFWIIPREGKCIGMAEAMTAFD